jgi:predicted nucleic acid-binding protein
MFRSRGALFLPDISAAASPDSADTKFLHCAQAAQADYIVTGNKRDFPDASYGVTRVVNAGELLDWITFQI